MEIYLGITIKKMSAQIKLAHDRNDNILAFGELWFFEESKCEPAFKVKGFTVKLKKFKGKEILAVDFPAFPSKKSLSGFQTSFIFEDLKLVEDVRKMFLEEFNQISGSLSATETEELQRSELSDEEIEKISKEIDDDDPVS